VKAVQDGWLRNAPSILDVGCGVGTNTFWLAAQGFRATGIDVAPGAISAAESGRATKSPNPNFLVGDVLSNTLPPRQFGAGIDVGCFQTLPKGSREEYSSSLARLLTPGAPLILFWVGREEEGAWGPPHRLSVSEVTKTFESTFRVDHLVHRPREVCLTPEIRRSARPLATLGGYSARLVRRTKLQPLER
jgi:SAM-dependent methyltransferase